jgi:ketosteroid isomerase-like protein
MADPKQLTDSDKSAILDVINLVAYILDSRAYDRLGEVFAGDMHFNNPGRLTADGLDSVIAAFQKIATPAVSHHITNVVLTPESGTTVRTISKALTLRADKSITAAEYTDVLKKTANGWRIVSRNIRALS